MTTTYTYKQVNDLKINADLYQTDKKHAPLIIYIHGGGLIWGTQKDINQEQVKLFNEHGYHVLSIAYRLAPETKLPEIITDIEHALEWAMNDLTEHLAYNREKIIVMGNSAGGYLSLMTGSFKQKPQAIVSFYGYGNILGDWYLTPSEFFNKMPQVNRTLAFQLIRNQEIAEAPITTRYAIYLYCRQQGVWTDFVADPLTTSTSDLQQYCPAEIADSTYPPTLLLHGDADEDVPYSESVQMHEVLKKQNVKTKLITIPDGKHQFDEAMDDPIVNDALQQVLQFIDEV